MDRKLRIAIDCRIMNSQQGVGTAVITLAKALSSSNLADQEYTFIVRMDMQDWLAPYISGPCKLAGIPASKFSTMRDAVRWIGPLRFLWRNIRRSTPHVPVSDGYVESQEFDLVHFPTQAAYLTDLPSIYQPWDLQHIHYPQFFSKSEIALREKYYRAFCSRSQCVCVQAEWTKLDIIQQYGLTPEKVTVVPWGSVFDAYSAPSSKEVLTTVKKYALPDFFFFYPAATWPHKNHEAIFRALDILKTRYGVTPHIYFTGSSTENRTILDKLALSLGISGQIHFLGFLSPEELQGVFAEATAMVFASKFEGFGLPILEAFHAGLPVLSSNATTLPEVAGDAALYFDPDSPSELAILMKRILDSPQLRQDLIVKGKRVLSRHSIENIAVSFQELYERIARLSQREHRLSAAPSTT
jgi:glycosyltransferase involved in cell wall biosynthesis